MGLRLVVKHCKVGESKTKEALIESASDG